MGIKLDNTDINGLDVVSCSYNLRKDLVTFVDFCDQNHPKRGHRNNNILKADLRKIAKAFGNKDVINNLKEHGESNYIDYIDNLAHKLKLIGYDTEGMYAGYHSSEPSFPDNYIEVNDFDFEKYIGLSPFKQDEKLLTAIIFSDTDSNNEFHSTNYHSRLDEFRSWNSRALMQSIRFDIARRQMLDILSRLPAGKWYSTQSLIKYLKQEHPFFLVPKERKYDRWATDKSRYSGIVEVRAGDVSSYRSGIQINEKDADAFERVEGRWVERFLEYVPLIMGFVDVAYDKDFSTEIYPVFNKLKAFKVNHRLKNYYQKDYPVKATLQPNFDLVVEAPVYPTSIAHQFIKVCNVVTEEPHLVLRLDKQKVLKFHAENTDENIIDDLDELISNPMPANVRIELKEWMGQTDKFVLYTGYDLYENNSTNDAVEQKHVINKKFSLVKDGQKVYDKLLVSGKVPVLINHKDERFTLAPRKSKTIFATLGKTVEKAKTRQRVNIAADTYIVYSIDNKNFYKELLLRCMEKKLLDYYDEDHCTIKFNKKLEKSVSEVIKKLKADYIVSVKS